MPLLMHYVSTDEVVDGYFKEPMVSVFYVPKADLLSKMEVSDDKVLSMRNKGIEF